MDIKVGATQTVSIQVDNTNTASAMGSGLVDVYATPMMVALMENAASEAIRPFLEEGQASVGAHISVSHDAATPVGMTVTATATVTAVDRRKVEFDVEAKDEKDVIGKGTHTRFVIDVDKFTAKAQEKASK